MLEATRADEELQRADEEPLGGLSQYLLGGAPIDDEEPLGARLYIDDTEELLGGRDYILTTPDAIYYIVTGARLYIWARTSIYIWARASLYLGAARQYIWARHDINAIYEMNAINAISSIYINAFVYTYMCVALSSSSSLSITSVAPQ